MRVLIPTWDSLLAKKVYMGSQIIIECQEFPVDLILLDIRDFDVIFGIDWLSRHHPIIDCFLKKVKFIKEGEPDVAFRGVW